MATLLTDTFDRANNTTVLGGPVTGGPYTVRAGTWGVIGNQCYTSVSTAASQVTFPAAADVDLQATFPVVVSSGGGVMARWTAATDYWYLGLTGTTWALMRNTVATGLSSVVIGPTAVNGDTVRLICLGRYVYGFVNGRMVAAAEDSFPSATVAGLRINSSISLRIDNLSAADATSVPGAPTTADILDLTEMPMFAADAAWTDGWLYRGRDTRTADAGRP